MYIDHRLRELTIRRSIFHSEADFQHSLAWILHNCFPNAGVRLEYPVRLLRKNEHDTRHLDIWVKERKIAIELKYKTDSFSGQSEGEKYLLKHHKPHNGRYMFIKDIKRLEDLLDTGAITKGYAILLTNNERLWHKSRKSERVSAEFSLEHGTFLKRKMKWKSGRRDSISLRYKHEINWKPYSTSNGSIFKYLVVRVKQKKNRS